MPDEVIIALLSQGPTKALPAHVTSPTSRLISTPPPGYLQRIRLSSLWSLNTSKHRAHYRPDTCTGCSLGL